MMGTQAIPEQAETPDARDRILAAAFEEFSRHGVEGTTLRQIAARAHVQHQLIVYHFGNKEALWRAVLGGIAIQPHRGLAALSRDNSEPAAKLRALISAFVRLNAQRPQLHRLITFEVRADSERLHWWIEELSAPFYALSTRLIREAQDARLARAGHPGRLHYAMIGIVTTCFTFAPEYSALTGLDPLSDEEVQATTGLACDFLGLPATHRPETSEKDASDQVLMVDMLRAVYWFDDALQAGLFAKAATRFTRSQSLLIMNVVAGETRSARLADNLGVSPQAISLMIRDMARAGILRLEQDPNDRRAPCPGSSG
jgi:AcrR family transcriptional regulator